MIQGVLTKMSGLWGAMGGVSELGGQWSERRLGVLPGHRGREGQRGSLMPPTSLAHLRLGPGGLPRAHRGWGGACYAFTPCPCIPMLRAEATSLASSSFLPPPWPPSAEMGVIRLEGDLGSDYLGWKLAPCVFFHPAQDWRGGEQLLHHQPGRANLFTNMFETRV